MSADSDRHIGEPSQSGGTLPEAWATATLGDLLDGIDAGRSFLCEERPPTDDEVGVVKISAVSWGTYDELESKTCTNPELIEERFVISEGDLLISRANTLELVGSCVVASGVTKKIMLSDKVLRLRIRSPFLKKWVLHFLRSPEGRRQIEILATGNQQSMRNIGQDRLRAIEVPTAPLAEQHRIVEKVEALFESLDGARDRLSTATRALKSFRRRVIDQACKGHLTRNSRALEDGDDLLPTGWQIHPFGSVIHELRNGLSTKPNVVPPGVPILRINAARSGHVSLETERYIPDAEDLLERFAVRDGDLLFTRYNGTIDLLGVCGMVRGLGDRPMLYPDKLIRVRTDHELLLPSYAELVFQSTAAREGVTAEAKSSAGQQGLSGADLKRQSILLPPISEQKEIVGRVQEIMTLIDAIEARTKAASSAAERIDQSVLTKAFAGELLPTEAELARHENRDYEPASVLLERTQQKSPSQSGVKNAPTGRR